MDVSDLVRQWRARDDGPAEVAAAEPNNVDCLFTHSNFSLLLIDIYVRIAGDVTKYTDFLDLLVLKDGNIVSEDYWLTGGPDVKWLSMSVAKSFVSALVGIALQQGRIDSIDDPMAKYLPDYPQFGDLTNRPDSRSSETGIL